MWVVANFKETQLARMHAGEEVELTVDALPNQTLCGKLESLSPASGAQFALLPPDNATGNFNKVVQRVPVKITLDEASLQQLGDRLRLGLSVIVNVKVR
jgi:membrane fusion protein (multidrug efflux system)